ncbi:MAG: hypothetical protein HOM25_17300 [Rhodospirillaceae bacterium]|nr:hypothetical protein [Rhodospirillaceae bacterium]
MHSTTATRLVVAGWLAALFLTPLSAWEAAPAWGAAPERGTGAFGLFLDRVAAFAAVNRPRLTKACGPDRLCAARLIVGAQGLPARLEAVVHPDTDSIRRATSQRSISQFRSIDDGLHVMQLGKFSRKLNDELLYNINSLNNLSHLIIDLRGNRGGDFDRMRRATALFTGPIAAALTLTHRGSTQQIDIPAPDRRLAIPRLSVLIGPHTASSAEVLAVLLRKHANATVLGARSFGKDYLYRIIPVTHDWRLLLPAEQISVSGQTLAGGVIPDGPIPRDLASQID